MDARQMLQYLDTQDEAIEDLVGQLDEVQVAFNALFDEFKAQHDARLDELTGQVFDRLGGEGSKQRGTIPDGLRAAIDERLPEERQAIDERRSKVREEYLPARQQAADELLQKAQAQVAALRALNPELDAREEELKAEKAELEARLAGLNVEIRQKSRGLGVVRHFASIFAADRERQQTIGKLEVINQTLQKVRREWEEKQSSVEAEQAGYQNRWQLESIAVARLQSELDQLDDQDLREDLALRRAIRHVLDEIKEPLSSADPELDAGLREMVELNIQTDAYHEGLASVGGFIGLLRGIRSGLQAIRQSIDGLIKEQRMHSEFLPALQFNVSDRVQDFHRQWPALARQFADEAAFGQQPTDFSAAVEPLLAGPLSQASIEAVFDSLGNTIERATERWG
jgi:DNA repair exonuclease SbcCD ATPase subunit